MVPHNPTMRYSECGLWLWLVCCQVLFGDVLREMYCMIPRKLVGALCQEDSARRGPCCAPSCVPPGGTLRIACHRQMWLAMHGGSGVKAVQLLYGLGHRWLLSKTT